MAWATAHAIFCSYIPFSVKGSYPCCKLPYGETYMTNEWGTPKTQWKTEVCSSESQRNQILTSSIWVGWQLIFSQACLQIRVEPKPTYQLKPYNKTWGSNIQINCIQEVLTHRNYEIINICCLTPPSGMAVVKQNR